MTQSFTPAELQDLVSAVRPIARAASAAILRVYETDFAVESKDDHSPLTQADLASHRLICAALARLSSKLPVLSEESASVPFEERLRWQRYWLVDPLDGTKEFVKRNGEFTVNIALIDDHCPVVGVVDVPTLETVYYAARGVGSFKQVREGTPERLATRPLRLSEVALVGSRSHASGRAQTFVDSFGPSARLLTIGSSLKFCMVAEGSADVYPRFGPTSEWDSAAAQCVVEQAGGGVLGLDLKPLRYNTKAELLNPDFLVVGDPNFDWRSRIEH